MTAKHAPEMLFNQAAAAHQRGQLEAAAAGYEAFLKQVPGHADAHHLLGVCLGAQGRLEEAARHLRSAVRSDARNPLYHNNLGEVYRRLNRLEEATACFREALRRAPDLPQAHYNLGTALSQAGAYPEAIRHLETALRLQPQHPGVSYNLGNALLATGRFREAAEAYEKALSIRPAFPEARNNLGIALYDQDRLDEAVVQYGKALALKEDFPEAHRNLGSVLEKQGRMDEARGALRRALALAPGDHALRLHAEALLPPVATSNEDIDAQREGLDRVLDRFLGDRPAFDLQRLHLSGGEPPVELPYQGRDDLPLKRKWAEVFRGSIPHAPLAPRSGKPRVGFVVTHGHEGVFLKCMKGLLRNLPAGRLDLWVVCSEQGGPQILEPALAAPGVRLLPLPARLDRAMARLAEACFDVLYYWEVGTDITNYVLPMARCAPVQCAGWGWPVTTGLAEMDFFLSCDLLETAESEAHYSEQLVRLRRLPTYYYRPPLPERRSPRARFGLEEAQHVYLCPQNVRKLHPDLDPLWAAILRQDPAGLLVLIADSQPLVTERLLQRLAATMPDVRDRVRMMPRMDEPAYLNLLLNADVVLDSLHYGGGANTTYDALAAAKPVVTLPTRFHRGRYALAAYRQMDLDVGIARNTEEYVEQALRLGSDRAYRDEMSQTIGERSRALLEDQTTVEEHAEFFESAALASRTR